jgi:hypothetical protein
MTYFSCGEKRKKRGTFCFLSPFTSEGYKKIMPKYDNEVEPPWQETIPMPGNSGAFSG